MFNVQNYNMVDKKYCLIMQRCEGVCLNELQNITNICKYDKDKFMNMILNKKERMKLKYLYELM